MLVSNDWKDYRLIDAGNGEKLESWGNVILRRPDPWALWTHEDTKEWNKYSAIYHRSEKGGGYWEKKKEIPEFWTINYKDLKFKVSPTGFKHTGLFPEQAVNWDIMSEKIKNAGREIRVLNLFAYTGGATVACLKAGAHVTHVDSSRGMIDWCKENVKSSKVDETKVRFLVDDCVKLVKREIRRGNKYDAIIMDPPSYGKGANGEIWSLEKDLYNLVNLVQELLSDNPICIMINSYSGLSPIILEDILKLTDQRNGHISSYEIGLKITNNNLILPAGITGIVEYE